jgi:CBS domain-containing membrane protein
VEPTAPEQLLPPPSRSWRGRRHTGGGTCPQRHCPADIARSWVGAFVGIFAVGVPAGLLHLASATTLGLIGSFGASAVLIYGLPRADLAQPRNFVGGHVVSAAVGVTVYQLVGAHQELAAALAVACAVAAMHVTRTIHPPGGATALIAVTGGSTVHRLGYLYVVAPVLVGAAIMLVVALIVNNLTVNRRRNYPTYWW